MSTRDDDLHKLWEAKNNQSLSDHARRAAAQNFEKIKEQSRDPRLEALRRELRLAKLDNNHRAIERIEGEIASVTRR